MSTAAMIANFYGGCYLSLEFVCTVLTEVFTSMLDVAEALMFWCFVEQRNWFEQLSCELQLLLERSNPSIGYCRVVRSQLLRTEIRTRKIFDCSGRTVQVENRRIFRELRTLNEENDRYGTLATPITVRSKTEILVPTFNAHFLGAVPGHLP